MEIQNDRVKAGKELIQDDVEENILAPFNPSSDQAQQICLKMFNLDSDDVLFDVGCGDGRFLLKAPEYCRCIGIELQKLFADRAVESVKNLPEQRREYIDIRYGDIIGKDPPISVEENIGTRCHGLSLFDDCTALYLYLLPKGLIKLQSLLDEIADNRRKRNRRFRVVTYMFQIRPWKPTLVERTEKGGFPVYFYHIV